MNNGDDCCGTSIPVVLKFEIAYSGKVSVTVAMSTPIRLAIWPGGCSDWCSGLADSMLRRRVMCIYELTSGKRSIRKINQ